MQPISPDNAIGRVSPDGCDQQQGDQRACASPGARTADASREYAKAGHLARVWPLHALQEHDPDSPPGGGSRNGRVRGVRVHLKMPRWIYLIALAATLSAQEPVRILPTAGLAAPPAIPGLVDVRPDPQGGYLAQANRRCPVAATPDRVSGGCDHRGPATMKPPRTRTWLRKSHSCRQIMRLSAASIRSATRSTAYRCGYCASRTIRTSRKMSPR